MRLSSPRLQARPRESRCHLAATRSGGGREQRGRGGKPGATQACVVIAGTRDGWSFRLAQVGVRVPPLALPAVVRAPGAARQGPLRGRGPRGLAPFRAGARTERVASPPLRESLGVVRAPGAARQGPLRSRVLEESLHCARGADGASSESPLRESLGVWSVERLALRARDRYAVGVLEESLDCARGADGASSE
jgi:hypothetical protein